MFEPQILSRQAPGLSVPPNVCQSQANVHELGPELDSAISPELRVLLACPDCRGELGDHDRRLCCAVCRQDFAVAADGTLPVLMSRQSDLFRESHGVWRRAEQKGTPKKSYRESRRLPPTSTSRLTDEPRARFLKEVGTGKILNIGSGERRVTTHLERWINLDICPHNNVDVVGDAHWLPFRDASFEGVTTSNVFAFLRDPFKAAAEIARVLKPGGLMWCNEAFAIPLSYSPSDFFRYTPDGLKSVFRQLVPMEVGPAAGPCKVISRFTEAAMEAAFPGKLGFIARWCAAWAMHPTKFLDDWLVRRNPESASSFYLIARKP